MINKKILGLIGLSAKAGKVCFGADSVENQVMKKNVKLIIVSNEASERTKDKFKKISEKYNIPFVIFGNIDELSKAIGKRNKAIIGIKDIHLSNEIQKLINGGEAIE